MVTKEQIVSMYRDHKETFVDEIEELNEALGEMGINCEVMSKPTSDGEELIFKKTEI